MFLHIVLLENEQILLHASSHNKDNMHTVILECELIYDYALHNKPLRVVETVAICQNDEINFFVKKYMKFYGIDNVRGGSYINKKLTDTERSIIILEQQQNLKTNKLCCDIISDIVVKYNEIDTWSTDKIKLAYETCIKHHNNYENEKQMLHNFTVGYENIEINRIILSDLTWLTNQCAKAIKLTPYGKGEDNNIYKETETIKKYKKIVIKIKSLYRMFTNYMDETNTYQPLIHLYSPETILDQYFYNPKVTQCVLQYDSLIKYFAMCEYMAYCIICRIQEYTFDVNSYSSNFEMINKYEIAFLEKHISDYPPISCDILDPS